MSKISITYFYSFCLVLLFAVSASAHSNYTPVAQTTKTQAHTLLYATGPSSFASTEHSTTEKVLEFIAIESELKEYSFEHEESTANFSDYFAPILFATLAGYIFLYLKKGLRPSRQSAALAASTSLVVQFGVFRI